MMTALYIGWKVLVNQFKRPDPIDEQTQVVEHVFHSHFDIAV